MTTPLVELRDVAKSYGPNRVLDGISMRVDPGEAVSVVGENGAGKSTLAKILTGVIRADAGEMLVGGATRKFRSPRDALQSRIAFVPQELAYFNALTVAENIVTGTWPSRFGFVGRRSILARGDEEARAFGIQLRADQQMSSLKLAERQLVEIVKGLARGARLIVLDEPTAALTQHESDNLFRVLDGLRGQGVGVVYITHRLDEVLRISDRVIVLRNGRLVASTTPRDTTPAKLVGHILGAIAANDVATRGQISRDARPTLALESWTLDREPRLRGVNLSVSPGEIVGMFGLRGSGVDAVAEGLGGLNRAIEGTVAVNGARGPIFQTPHGARKAGVTYLPQERKRDGLLLEQSIQANIALYNLKSLSRKGYLDRTLERSMASFAVKQLSVRHKSLRQSVGELSGGNQQKVLFASRLAKLPQVLVLHEPTRGVDVGARSEIHRVIQQLADRQVGVLIATSDVAEAVAVSDRLLVFRDGAVVADLSGDTKTQAAALEIAAHDDGV